MKTKPVEALKIIDENWDKGGTPKNLKIADMIACNVAFKEGQSNPKIKQLEWRDSFKGTLLKANTGFLNSFQIAVKKENEFMLILSTGDAIYKIGYFASLDEAKHAAQKDFERRIKGCLITE